MLSSRAYSFRQQTRLAISLSWIGGYTNVIALLAMGTVASHVTGTVTQVGRGIGARDLADVKFFGFILICFLGGAALSACLTETARRRSWRSRFVLPIGLEAALLCLMMVLLSLRGKPQSGAELYQAVGLAAAAMGLQNATITKISGAVVRTTHLTGIVTDLGLEGMHYLYWWGDQLRKRRPYRVRRLFKVFPRHPGGLRVLLLLSIIGSFGFGTVIGTIAFARWTSLSILAPIGFLVWIIYVDWRKPIVDIRELDLANDPDLRLDEMVSKLLPPEVVLYRSIREASDGNRPPNFQRWVDRVPDTCRVIVLAVNPLMRFDGNTMIDLEAALKRLDSAKKKLILSGITPAQFRELEAVNVTRRMDANNLCPDLEFAIARAIAITQQMGEYPTGHRRARYAPETHPTRF